MTETTNPEGQVKQLELTPANLDALAEADERFRKAVDESAAARDHYQATLAAVFGVKGINPSGYLFSIQGRFATGRTFYSDGSQDRITW